MTSIPSKFADTVPGDEKSFDQCHHYGHPAPGRYSEKEILSSGHNSVISTISDRRPEKEARSSGPNSVISTVSRNDLDEDDLALTVTQSSTRSASRRVTQTSTRGTTFTSDPAFEVDFADGDPHDPRNWPAWYKGLAIFAISAGTLVVVLYSTSYTAAIGAIQKEFHINSEPIATLGVTTYLCGLAIGSLVLAPIAETYGRKPVYTTGMFVFTLLMIPAARAHSMAEIIVVRFFGALFGSAMIANAPGTIADIISEEYRPTAFSIWSIGPMNGPVFGPVIGGFVTQYKGWRWATWVVMIISGAAFLVLACVKETYGPVLLQKRAEKIRKETGEHRYWSRYDIRVGFVELMKVNLSRPFIMAVKEPICIFWNVYVSLIYGILYLCFVAYPIVFTELRGWSIGMSGLSFLGIGIGTMIIICCATPIRWIINAHKRDEEGNIPPESMMSVLCVAAILVPIGELWFAWTCYPTSIHWAIPIAAGIPFGCGNGAVFIYAGNYLAYSYGIYSASAMAGNAFIRSIMGGTLPLAGPSMYRTLGPNWAGTLLGLLEVLIIPIPFLFYRYGHKIRERSPLIRDLRENERRQERKRKRAEERLRRAEQAGTSAEKAEAREELQRVVSNVDRNIEDMAEAELARVQGIEIGKDVV